MNKIKKLLSFIFGNTTNLSSKANIATFFTAIFLTIILFAFKDMSYTLQFQFQIVAGFFFVIWLSDNNKDKIICDIIRTLSFFMLFLLSFSYLVNVAAETESYKANFLLIFLSSITLFACLVYFISLFSKIFDTFRKAFNLIKLYLFGSDNPSSKLKNFIENITVIAVSIGGFLTAIIVIFEAVGKIIS